MRTSTGWSWGMVAFGASLLLTAGRAAADAPPASDVVAARALFAQALVDEQAGHWADAQTKLRRASAVKLTPGLRFHLALCDERLGHLVAAREGYLAAEAAAKQEKNREVLDLVSEPLESLKVRTPTVRVNLQARFAGHGSGAEVRVDGVALPEASLGTPVAVDVGTHTIQATAPRQTPYAMTLTVVERQAATVDIVFLPLPGQDPAGAPPAPILAGPTPAPSEPTETPPHPSDHPSRTLAIVATAGAVVLVAGGFAAFAAAGSDQSYWDGKCQGLPLPCGNPTPVRTWDAVALGGWIAGAGVGVVSVLLWTQSSSPSAAHATLKAGPGTLGLAGTF